MNSFEVLALLGAMSWLPHLVKLIKDLFLKPKIRIIMPRFVEIGFTTYGHIFNTKIAFVTERKDIVISGLQLNIQHESGEEKILYWQGVVQRYGELKNIAGSSMPWEKEHSVLAIKLTQKDIDERFIRFQEETFLTTKDGYENSIVKKAVNISKNKTIEFSDIERIDEFQDLIRHIKQSFNWKAGKYRLEFNIVSSIAYILEDNVYTFELTQLEIQGIEQNKDLIEKSYQNQFGWLIDPDYKGEDIFWNWRYPRIILKEINKV